MKTSKPLLTLRMLFPAAASFIVLLLGEWWQEIETIGTDAILVHTAVPKAPAAPHGFWQQLRAKLGL